MPEPSLAKIEQIAIQASDLGRAKAFYGDILGLKLMFEAGPMAFFDVGGVRLLVGPMHADRPPSGETILYFGAGEDWAATEAFLERRGVKFAPRTEVVQRAAGKEHVFRLFKDPDGNHLAIMGWRNAA